MVEFREAESRLLKRCLTLLDEQCAEGWSMKALGVEPTSGTSRGVVAVSEPEKSHRLMRLTFKTKKAGFTSSMPSTTSISSCLSTKAGSSGL